MKSVLEAMTELVSRGYPKDTAYRIASGDLPMDRASRMERAREQGYSDDVFYKGMYPYDYTKESEGYLGPVISEINRQSPFPSFGGSDGDIDIAGFMSKDPDVASRFAGPNITRRGAIFPLRTKNNAVGVIDAKGKNAGDVQFGESGRPFRDMVRSGEYDSVAIKNTADEGDVYIALEPSNIRSQFAAFDPEYKGGNILGGTAATAIGAGALMSPNDASAAIEDVDIFEEEMPMSRRQRAQAQRERVLGASDPLLSGAQTANLLAGLTGVAGVADIFGEYPEFPEGDVSVGEMVLEGQRGPSLAENLGEGNYLSAGLQTLGIIPLVGLGARAAARALRSSNELSAEQLNEFGKVLERAIEEKAPNLREIVENHPVVVEAMAQIGRIPLTNEAKGFGSPEWLENRVFQFRKGDEVEEVIGYDDAVDRLYDQSKSLAWTDDGLTYPGPATRTGDKTAVIVLGPPASGKSSISNPIARKYDATIIDSDEAKKLLPEYAGGVGANAVHAESKAIIRQMEDIAIDEGDNLVIPTVGENAGKIRDRIDRYQNAGYNVQIVDVQVPAEEAAIRMFRRFYKTGRMIPTDHMNKVGNKPSATYDILREEGIADGFTRIDNTVPIDQPKPVLEDTGGLLEGTEIRLRGSGRNRGNDSGKPGVSGSQQKTARATQGEEKGIGSL
jgi:predicted ABC-type ATPase